MDTLQIKKLERRTKHRKLMEKLKGLRTSKIIAKWKQSK